MAEGLLSVILIAIAALWALLLWIGEREFTAHVFRRRRRRVRFSLLAVMGFVTAACVFLSVFRPQSVSELLLMLVQLPVMLTVLGLAASVPLLAILLLEDAFARRPLNTPARRRVREVDGQELAKELQGGRRSAKQAPNSARRRKWWRRPWQKVFTPGRLSLSHSEPSS
jgi:NhaP-type Na+/H+ or K+/H+ antiporter